MTHESLRTTPTPRVDALGKVTGAAPYPGDVTPPELLHAKVLFSGQPHARMRAHGHQRALRRCPALSPVLTAKDVPVNEYGLIMPDQPVLVGLGSSNPIADVSRWEGDQVALVVAESEAIAAAGLRADRD